MLKSPTCSEKKFCWMFYLVLINSLTIKSLFLGSVIFRNDMFLLTIYFFFERGFEQGFEHGFERGLNTNSSQNTNLISTKQLMSFSFNITSFFKADLRFYSKVLFYSCERFKLQ